MVGGLRKIAAKLISGMHISGGGVGGLVQEWSRRSKRKPLVVLDGGWSKEAKNHFSFACQNDGRHFLPMDSC